MRRYLILFSFIPLRLCSSAVGRPGIMRPKAWPNARNISTQHLAAMLGTTCCIRLATLLRYVEIWWNRLDDVGSNLKTVKFFLHFGCYLH